MGVCLGPWGSTGAFISSHSSLYFQFHLLFISCIRQSPAPPEPLCQARCGPWRCPGPQRLSRTSLMLSISSLCSLCQPLFLRCVIVSAPLDPLCQARCGPWACPGPQVISGTSTVSFLSFACPQFHFLILSCVKEPTCATSPVHRWHLAPSTSIAHHLSPRTFHFTWALKKLMGLMDYIFNASESKYCDCAWCVCGVGGGRVET